LGYKTKTTFELQKKEEKFPMNLLMDFYQMKHEEIVGFTSPVNGGKLEKVERSPERYKDKYGLLAELTETD
jgi:hypothetical protein